MLKRNTIIGLCSFLGLTSIAVFAAAQSDATVEAGCATCSTVFYPGGGMSYGCKWDPNDNSEWGPQYCRIQGGPSSFTCSVEGYGYCS